MNPWNAVWPEWEAVREIGRGSFGTVYEAVRREYGIESRAAIKCISIPAEDDDPEQYRREGLDETAIRETYRRIAEDVTRFDLITLNFFVFSQADTPNPQKKRFTDYIESTNRILESSLMGELYVQNAYECFVLMCMLSEDPLCAYSDVWALSYEQEPRPER